VHLAHVDAEACEQHVSRRTISGMKSADSPPAVFSRRPHLSHLKCFAF
jgi:hypothetical protein